MSRFGTMLIAVAAATVTAVLAGCTTAAGGNPAPATQVDGGGESSGSVPPSSEESDRNGAPRVTDPLDADRFLADPCAALTQAQVAGFGFTGPGTPETEGGIATEVGPGCTWQGTLSETGTIGIGFMTGNKNGLADTYGARDQYAYFEETTVSGYPAVFTSGIDSRDMGSCSMLAGTSDSLSLFVLEQGDLDAVGACERAKQVAAAVITTMQGG